MITDLETGSSRAHRSLDKFNVNMAFISNVPLFNKKRCIKLYCATTMTGISSSQRAFSAGVETLQNEGAYAVMEAARSLELQTGKSVVHLEIGQPGFDTPPNIATAGISAIRAGKTRYSSPAGLSTLRTAIALWARENRKLKWVAPENVVIGPGAKPGLFFSTLAIVRGPEDRVIIPDPGFPTYTAMIAISGGTAVPVRLNDDMQSFDMNALRKAVDERTRLVVLNSPGNPTGGVIPLEDLQEIACMAEKFDFWVMSDEIYSQLVYNESYTSIASLPGMAQRTIVVDGFSKSFCMTGWRLGWAIMPVDLAQRVELLLVHSVGCTATFIQEAGITAIQSVNDGSIERMRDEFRKRRDLVVSGLNTINGVSCSVPDGAFYAWADIRSFGKSSRYVADFLLKEGFVAVLPGTDFGKGGEGFIRLSYVSEEEVLKEGLQRIRHSLMKIS